MLLQGRGGSKGMFNESQLCAGHSGRTWRGRYAPCRSGSAKRATKRRIQGAISVTVGNAIGHVVAQLLAHCDKKSGPSPWVVAMTNAETMATMMTDKSAPKAMGA